jgi:3-methyladenine DNA glycosylase AlkD
MVDATSSDSGQIAEEINQQILALPIRKAGSIYTIRRKFSLRLKDSSPTFVLELAVLLIKKYDQRELAYDLVHHHSETFRCLGEAELDQLGHAIDSWWSTDAFALQLAGTVWREGQIGDQVIHRWARSEDHWWRRAALVSTIPLNVEARGGHGDVARTIEVCEILIADDDDMVITSLSWALRELVQHDQQAVQNFLEKHQDELADRVQTEVKARIST